MTNYEIVTALVEKTGISYEEAKAVLEANNYDLLDAVIALERAGKLSGTKNVEAEEQSRTAEIVESEVAEDSSGKEKNTEEEKEMKKTNTFTESAKRLGKAAVDNRFVIARKDQEILNVPILVLIIALIINFPLFTFLLILGLFLGCRYRFGGTGILAENANEMSEQAADLAESIRTEFTN